MRLDQLRDRFGDAVDITWRAFLLRTESKGADREKFVRYTESWRRPASMEPAAEFRVWATDAPQPTSSVPAHVAAKAVAESSPDAYDEFHHRLLRAYFAQNRTISDWAVLAEIADETGLDRDAFLTHAAHRERALVEEVLDEHNAAVRDGITSVPTMVFDGVLPVPGAQEVDTLARWIERLLERRGR